MPALFKVDATKRVIRMIQAVDYLDKDEKKAYLFGMRSMARVCAGESSGVYRLLDDVIEGRVAL